MSSEEQDQLASLRIGMAATLSGVPIGTIRVWERRYRVLAPKRTPQGGRLYSMRDVARLRMLRELADRGHAIGTIAGLSDEVLRQRLDIAVPMSASVGADAAQASLQLVAYPSDNLHIGVFGSDPALVLLPGAQSAEALLAKAPKRLPDVVVLKRDRLHGEDASLLLQLADKLRCGLMLVEYQFSTEAALSLLDRAGIVLLPGPVAPRQLMRIAQLYASGGGVVNKTSASSGKAVATSPAPGAVPEPLYSEGQLLELGRLRSSLKCECPRQISDLLLRLGAFERYSQQCAIATPEDAAEHRRLGDASGQARVIMEQALQQLLQQA